MKTARAVATTILVTGLALGACSSGSGGETAPNPSTSRAKAGPLTILVTNDDGYAAPGIDTVVEALRNLPDVKVTVVAPAEQRSGTDGKTTPGELTATEAKTASGYPATAVDGYPADTITYALAHEFSAAPPDLVVSGVNEGQNLGPIAGISGTIGAAEAAAAQGIPTLAASAGFAAPLGQPAPVPPDYETTAARVVQWVKGHRRALAAGPPATATIVNINTPTCTSGHVRGLRQVPLATNGAGALDPADCTSTVTDVADDIAAFHNGFTSVTELTATAQTVTTSTTWPER